MSRIRNPVYPQGYRGFESHLLRHFFKFKLRLFVIPSGFFREGFFGLGLLVGAVGGLLFLGFYFLVRQLGGVSVRVIWKNKEFQCVIWNVLWKMV